MEGALGSGVQGPPQEGVHEPTSDQYLPQTPIPPGG